ncbi:Iron-containing redox enzyme [Streptomyces zhaozhouensis]|uniref:Iron-containing redox enzyme n=1 Tax=Streptomyces zhaozhouensis TaxID=1300267 RepID=A0A286DVW6_9ACTN|nr:iron-containing redox enzyme family protein [Streptomyces zhaozhouensis]SOD62815.1 Iron-containing redox enzyme [Streptomyces zhaozhouensis]
MSQHDDTPRPAAPAPTKETSDVPQDRRVLPAPPPAEAAPQRQHHLPDELTPRAEPAIPDHRALYLRALDPEGPLPLDPRTPRHLRAALGDPPPDSDPTPDLDALTARARAWSAETTRRFTTVLAPLTGAHRTPAARCVLLNTAPLALTTGAWLQWLTSAGNAETEPALRALALYASDLGVGLPDAHRGADYRALLARHHLEPATPGLRLAASEHLITASFRLPGVLLAMSRLPDHFRPEILGADLCLRAAGLAPPLAALTGHELDEPTADALDPGAARAGGTATGLALSTAAARALLAEPHPDTAPRTARRLHHGHAWALRELARWSEDLLAETALTQHPDYGVWRLIHTRARPAAVYHSGYTLAGRPLADWFQHLDDGPGPFLDALARSPLVRPGRPDASPLVCGLIDARGPMFRVFTDDETATLRRWIARLPERDRLRAATPGGTPAADRALADARHRWNLPAATAPEPEAEPADAPHPDDPAAFDHRSPRAAYHALLSRRTSPALRRFAHDYTTRWLTRARYRLRHAPGQLPARWDRVSGLRDWLATAHDRHAEQLDRAAPPLPTREELVDSTLQLAPLIMIDGGWLQGFTDHHHASAPSGHFLFRTYWDELGNGESEWNHPRIYRELLAEMGIELPATDAPEFSAWPGFRDASFATPVYWLSISRFPQTFQPEILGLNLAMELSGVGGGYRSASLALRHHGYSTQFVDLHNTIDNVATGHSAWAVDAIDNYLADLPRLVGPHQEQAVWERVRVGYRSLNPPTTAAARLYAALRSRRGRARAAGARGGAPGATGTTRENR